MSLLSELNRLPPPLARIIAHPLNEKQLVSRSDLSLMTVRRMSWRPVWAGKIEMVSAFLEACGIEVKIEIPALEQITQAMESGEGLKGLKQLKKNKNAPLWQKAQRSKHIKRLLKAMK